MSVRLPLFPLAVTLYPSTTVPLHIFEPRYRQLVADCLASDEPFGIIHPGQDREAPPRGSIGCAARIREHELLPDGRSNILVAGEARFIIDEYVQSTDPYLVALVQEFLDDPLDDGIVRTDELERLFHAYVTAIFSLHDTEPSAVALSREPAVLTFQVAAALDLDASFQVRLLASRSARERTDLLMTWLGPRITDAEERAQLHRAARGNGHSTRPYPAAQA